MNREQYFEKFMVDYNPRSPILDIGPGDNIPGWKNFFHVEDDYSYVDIIDIPGVLRINDSGNLPFDDEEFNTIICIDALEHMKYPHVIIREMSRVLKLDGLLILISVFKWVIHDHPRDYWRFCPDGFSLLFKDADLKIHDVSMEDENESDHGIHIYGIGKK